ncbi:TPA: DNA primase, partial [Citrobacter freundii]|nr:DNA primase [Citrobacter freundii]
LRYWMNHCEICGERLGDYELFCVENDAFRLMTIEKLLRAKIRKVNKLFVSTAGNPAEHKITDIVRYLCDARFVMNGPA